MGNLPTLDWGTILTVSGYIAATAVFIVQSMTIRKIQLENSKLALERQKIIEEIEKLKYEREKRENPDSVVHQLTPEERDRFIPRPFERAPRSYRAPLMTTAIILFGASLWQSTHEVQQAASNLNELKSQVTSATEQASAATANAAKLRNENEELRKLVPATSIPFDQIRSCDEARVRLRAEVENRQQRWLDQGKTQGRDCSGSCHVFVEQGRVSFSLDSSPDSRSRISDIRVGDLSCPPFQLSVKK